MAEVSLHQEAERWCNEDCTGNRFWEMSEIMWFCTRCQVWYHYDCCQTPAGETQWKELEKYLQTPLLRGGPFGKIGTSPLVFSAAKVMQRIQQGDGAGENWEKMLDEILGQPAEEFLKEMRELAPGPLDSCPTCPTCD